jgi:hypothetical protein
LTPQNSEIRELAGKLASEQQARLGLSDRFDTQTRALKEAEKDADEARAKLEELDQQRTDEDRKKGQVNDQAVGQLKERNTLLLTIYQNLGRILGNDKALGVRSGYLFQGDCALTAFLFEAKTRRP